MLDKTWQKMYQKVKEVQGFREILNHMEAGGVAAAVLSDSGNIYTGVCADTACTLGVCAERNALFNMITNGESKITRVLTIMLDGKNGAPCGACREFMVQMMEEHYQDVEVMLDYEHEKVVTLGELTPDWWL
ncbi:cytidine deaminase family protein [Lactobacillus helveticus]|uniref:cytidine deaminase family protein n=1 Tax=Lactobacillus helveticus TaxID=1587 RepID=UPI00156295A3|nr:cytidine deaminase [Lactobacillus helveticus]NRN76807.1 Cytidine deaminase [Lactobacillus helveticus]NRO10650.1 Cytidine deaminase [Lactobacillus helveticus]NRO66672.1 Cytidine deaminase [Lactobacillus helveticus]